MRSVLPLIALTFLANFSFAQYVYTIKADSVKITNCDSSELILENHTQAVPGFLFNTGNGRTIFKRGAQRLTDSTYLVGADTIKMHSNAWIQGGNSFGTTGVLGTLDNNPLDFYSNGTQKLRLAPNGHLLLGTTTDNGNNVEINGSIFDTAGYFTNSAALLGGSSPTGAIRLRWGTGDGGYIGFYDQGDTKLKTYFGSFGDSRPFDIADSVGVSFYMTPYVSIGTETGVTSKLSVVNPYESGLYDLGLARVLSDGSRVYDVAVMPPGSVQLSGFADNGMKMQVNGTSVFAGNVGIGTFLPSAQLHTTGTVCFAGLTSDNTQTRILVSDTNGNLFYRDASSLAVNDILRSSLAVNGTITAKQLRLRPTDWPDYVFDSAYKLPSLPAIENYIRQQHHLPGIPSAQEVRSNGTDVGDNQAVLLKKVEELTLYIIEQNKKVEQQNKEIESLRQEMKGMKALITNKGGN
jgi:hypothetical protein